MFRTNLHTIATLLIGVSCGIIFCQLLKNHVLVIEIAKLGGLIGALIKIVLGAKSYKDKQKTKSEQK